MIEAHGIASRLGALPLREAIEMLAGRAGITLTQPVLPADGEGGDGLAAVTASSMPVPRSRHNLTPREREVLALLAAGRSDGEIADALFISKKTASFHVATIKSKLGARSRVEIATDAIGLGLIEAPSRERT